MSSYVYKLNAMLLGQSVSHLKSGNDWLQLDGDNLSKIEVAKASRNWIVHRSGYGLLLQSNKFDVGEFLDNVKAVAMGDLLVSRWSYEFHEKEPAGWCPKELYVETISRWIYDDLLRGMPHGSSWVGTHHSRPGEEPRQRKPDAERPAE